MDGRVRSDGSGTKRVPGTPDLHVQEVLRTAHDELRELVRKRADMVRRIGAIKQTIVGLANLFGDEILNKELQELVEGRTGRTDSRQAGFTKACRMVLMGARRPQGARDICHQIEQKYPSMLLRHKEPIASVTTVLNRLVKYGEAQTSLGADGRRQWQWVADSPESLLNHGEVSISEL